MCLLTFVLQWRTFVVLNRWPPASYLWPPNYYFFTVCFGWVSFRFLEQFTYRHFAGSHTLFSDQAIDAYTYRNTWNKCPTGQPAFKVTQHGMSDNVWSICSSLSYTGSTFLSVWWQRHHEIQVNISRHNLHFILIHPRTGRRWVTWMGERKHTTQKHTHSTTTLVL